MTSNSMQTHLWHVGLGQGRLDVSAREHEAPAVQGHALAIRDEHFGFARLNRAIPWGTTKTQMLN